MMVRAQQTTALAAGSAIAGLLAYVFFAVTTRALGSEAAAPVSVLWTYWSFAGAALTFPLQHWITRSVAAHGGSGQVRAALPRVVAVVAVATALVSLLAWLLREDLFHRQDAWFPVLVGLVTIGSAYLGLVRGGLAAHRRFVALAWALVSENAVRCAAAVGLMVAGVRASVSYGLCLAAGGIVGLLWPTSVRFARPRPGARSESPLAFLGGAAGGQLLGQTVLTGGPVLLALAGGAPPQVTALFAGLALFRAPYTLALGMVSQLTGRLTVLVVHGDRRTLRKVRVAVVATTLLAAGVAAVVGASVGPALIRLVFGDSVRLAPLPTAVVAVGSAVALANLVVTITVMAQNRSGAVVRAWAVAYLCGAVLFTATGIDVLERTCWTFLVAEVVAFVALLVEETMGTARLAPRRPDPTVDPSTARRV